jgi:hypothetical protein
MIRILENSDEWIKFRSTNDSINEAKQQWQKRYHFPAAIGALDCTQVRILKPSIHGDEYVNRKTFASLNVQATCNAKKIFTSIDASWPGSVHDSRIWRNSEIREQFSRRNNNAVLLEDSGYGLEPWLMTPFRNPANDEQQAFNRLFKSERVIIERCFGQVKRRFPILQYICRVPIEKIPGIITCCFVLHNAAKFLMDADFEGEEENNIDDNEPEEIDGNLFQRGQIRRNNIAHIIYVQEL